MTYHILTITHRGAWLSTSRGFLVCSIKGQADRRLPLADIRAVVIAVPQVSFSNQCLSRLLAQEVVVLHCAEDFEPVGWTVGLTRMIHEQAFFNQISSEPVLRALLWDQIIRQKISNQLTLLDRVAPGHGVSDDGDEPDEARIARLYWKHYFPALSAPQKREKRGAESFENKALNYGYAVLSTLVHRALLIHGLQPVLGIHHKERYGSTPLVYDCVEPLRPIVDAALYDYLQDNEAGAESPFREWIAYLMEYLKDHRLPGPNPKHSYKVVDFVEQYINSLRQCFASETHQGLLLPKLDELCCQPEKQF